MQFSNLAILLSLLAAFAAAAPVGPPQRSNSAPVTQKEVHNAQVQQQVGVAKQAKQVAPPKMALVADLVRQHQKDQSKPKSADKQNTDATVNYYGISRFQRLSQLGTTGAQNRVHQFIGNLAKKAGDRKWKAATDSKQAKSVVGDMTRAGVKQIQ
ncbi:hypothetical protein C8J56DRAFT_943298 [Mycena floridula]|nr:hypothetical protein C8J56DRAFT_943298 [Mycena floridula]